MFKNALDEVLEARLSIPSIAVKTADVGMGIDASAEELNTSWAVDGMEFLDTLDFGAVFDQWQF